MSLRVGAAYLDILPRVGRSFGGDMERAISKPTEDAGRKAGGVLGGALGKAAAAAGGLFAAKQVVDFLGNAAAAARESNKVSAQTEAVIKSTGGAAKLTAKQMGDLATRISNKTGVDDEAIQTAQNLLATFTNVRNEVGKGNDIFSQATGILVDMGAAMGTEPKAAAIQLGKALNDPIKGIAALSRVGVTFTDEQKNQIATMVEQGKTAEAQKVILAELRKEFGGSAAAQADASDRLKVTLGNLQETLGARLLPLLDRVAVFAADKLPGALDTAGRWFDQLSKKAKPTIEVAKRLAAFVKPAIDALNTLFSGDATGFAIELDVALAHLLPGLGSLEGHLGSAGEVILKVAGFVREHLKPILIGLGIAVALLTAPVTTVAAAVVFAYVRFETFRNVVNAVIGFLVNTAAPAVARFAKAVGGLIGDLVAYIKRIWPDVARVLDKLRLGFETFLAVVGAIWRTWGDDIGKIVGSVFGFVKSTIENVLQLVRGVIQLVLAAINGDWSKAWEALGAIVGAVFKEIGAIIEGAFGIISGLFGGIAHTLANAWGGLWEGIKAIARAAFEWVADNVLNPFIRQINTVIDGMNLLKPGADIKHLQEIKFAAPTAPDTTIGHGRGDVLRMHGGGVVPGRRGQEVPALLEGGEIVGSRGLADWLFANAAEPAGGEVIRIDHLEVTGSRDPDYSATRTTEALRGLAFKTTGRWGSVKVGRAAA